MIAVDTNILVYAHRRDSGFHESARQCVRALAEAPDSWAIPWPCLHEFLAIVTNPRIYKIPTPTAKALAQAQAWIRSPSLRLLSESDAHLPALAELLTTGRIVGGRVHDARIAALAVQHGVRELLSADRDFSRFPSLRVRNPL